MTFGSVVAAVPYSDNATLSLPFGSGSLYLLSFVSLSNPSVYSVSLPHRHAGSSCALKRSAQQRGSGANGDRSQGYVYIMARSISLIYLRDPDNGHWARGDGITKPLVSPAAFYGVWCGYMNL